MIRNNRVFYPIFFLSLLLCLGLYAEEARHYMHYGWNSPDNIAWTRDISTCHPVPGSTTDIECPVWGYGMARYRYKDHDDPLHNDIFFIDRIQ